MSGKERLTVTIDPELVKAGAAAVASGVAPSISAWVNLALTERARKERQLRALGDAIGDYEAEFGVITADEIVRQRSDDRAAGRAPRRAPRRAASKRSKRGAA
jgi:hypothetical protein